MRSARRQARPRSTRTSRSSRHGRDRSRDGRVRPTTSGAVHGLYAWNRKTKRWRRRPAARRSSLPACRGVYFITAPRGATGDGIGWRGGRVAGSPTWSSCSSTRPASTISRSKLPDYRGSARRGRAAEAAGGQGRCAVHAAVRRARELLQDIVARAIDHEIKRLGLDYVHLDISHREPEFVREHFPNIYEKLLASDRTSPRNRSQSSRRSITPAMSRR